MGRRTKTILAIGTLLGGGLLFARWIGGDDHAGKALDPGLVADRVWVEAEPDSLRQLVHRTLLVGSVRLGIFDQSSFYAGRHELFEWRRGGDKLSIVFPQDRRKAEVRFTVTRCDDLFPYDLCLDLSENPWGGPKRYFGLEDPEDGEDEGRAEARLRALLLGARP